MRSDNRYEAKGINPETGKRKSYYSRISQAHADALAKKSYGIRLGKSFNDYYLAAFIPAIVHRSENWRMQVHWAMNRLWKPAFGEKDIDQITRADIQATINEANLSLSPKSVQNGYKVLHALLELAEADEAIPRNPCIKIRMAPIMETNEKALSFTQLAKLLEHSQPLIKPFVILAGCCSLRRGEALGIKVSDVKDGLMKVERQVLQLRAKVEVTDTLKTPQSYRSIPLPEGLRAALMDCDQVSDVWVCSDSLGGYVRPQNVRRELTLAQQKAGLGEYVGEGKERAFIPLVSPHELRHTFVSLMENDLEIPARVVQALAGKGAKRSYSHAETKQMLKAMERYWEKVSTALTTTLTTELRVG